MKAVSAFLQQTKIDSAFHYAPKDDVTFAVNIQHKIDHFIII